jgi:hypothetical protein
LEIFELLGQDLRLISHPLFKILVVLRDEKLGRPYLVDPFEIEIRLFHRTPGNGDDGRV